MTNQTCSLCGVIIQNGAEMCATCAAMMGGAPAAENRSAPVYEIETGFAAPVEFETNYAAPVEFETNFAAPVELAPNFARPAGLETNYAAPAGFEPHQAPPAAFETDRAAGGFAPPAAQPAAGGFGHYAPAAPAPPADYVPPTEIQPATFAAPAFPPAAPGAFVPSGFATLDDLHANAAAAPPPPPPHNSYNYAPAPPPYPPRPAAKVVESASRPSIWYWFTELPAFVKIGLVVLIFSVAFAGLLKGFLKMDLSVVSNGSNVEMEPQKRWFSAWFRSNPTAEEVFEKYERETFTKGKKLSAQSYVVTGKAQILKNGRGGIIDLNAIKNNTVPGAAAATPTPIIQIQPQGGAPPPSRPPSISDFDIDFEMSVKNPDKTLMKMTMRPKDGFMQTFKALQMNGYDGERGWNFTKTYVNGKENLREDPYRPAGFMFTRTEDGLAMTSSRAMYSNVEFGGEEAVYNRLAYKLAVTDRQGEKINLFFDIETGLLSKANVKGIDVYVIEHKNFNAMLLPSKMVYQINADWLVMEMTDLKADIPLDDVIFQRASYK